MSSLSVITTDDDGHYYEFEGQRVPGVSEILEGADLMLKNAFYEERKAAAAIRGKDVHLACADLDRGLPDWWSDDPEIWGYIKAYQQFKADFQFRPTMIEKPMFHEIYRYAGTPDRMGTIVSKDGAAIVTLDLKAVATIGPHVRIQLAAYNLFADDHDDRIPIALQLKPSGKYMVHVADNPQDTQVFLACLTLVLWRDRHHKHQVYSPLKRRAPAQATEWLTTTPDNYETEERAAIQKEAWDHEPY